MITWFGFFGFFYFVIEKFFKRWTSFITLVINDMFSIRIWRTIYTIIKSRSITVQTAIMTWIRFYISIFVITYLWKTCRSFSIITFTFQTGIYCRTTFTFIFTFLTIFAYWSSFKVSIHAFTFMLTIIHLSITNMSSLTSFTSSTIYTFLTSNITSVTKVINHCITIWIHNGSSFYHCISISIVPFTSRTKASVFFCSCS